MPEDDYKQSDLSVDKKRESAIKKRQNQIWKEINEVEIELVEICEAIVIAEFDSETLKQKLVATKLARKKLYEELENVE